LGARRLGPYSHDLSRDLWVGRRLRSALSQSATAQFPSSLRPKFK